MDRRRFLGGALAAAAAASVRGSRARGADAPIPTRPLGRTGVRLPIVGLGGAHVGRQGDEEESVRIVRSAVDGGITLLDNSWDYNGGQSELRMGRALTGGYRERVFLMTKVDGRDGATAERQLHESLRRLRTDHVDLLQFHEVIRSSDPGRIFAKGGAMEAFLRARQAGKTRFIGFTGHKSPEIHLQMLRAWEEHGSLPDTVQMPLNVLDAGYDSFQARVLPELVRRGIGVLGMKPLGDGFVLRSGAVSAPDGLRYAMSVPGVSLTITGIDSADILDQALRIARGFEPLDEPRRRALEARAAPVATRGEYEAYKTSHTFDSTHQHPEWLG